MVLMFYRDDMGTFFQRGCKDLEDALWHVNNARDKDNLPRLSITEFMNDMDSSSCSFS
jgi:hypothetical protein